MTGSGVLSWGGRARVSGGDRAGRVSPAGYYNAKARKLKAFVEMLGSRFGGELERLLATPREELRGLLLATHGIGAGAAGEGGPPPPPPRRRIPPAGRFSPGGGGGSEGGEPGLGQRG